MRDSFATEFPSAAAALGRLRAPSVPREAWGWAALTALGASTAALALFQLPQIALRTAGLRDLASYANSAAAILAMAIGSAIAWRASGARAVALYLAVRVAYALAGLPGMVLFCDRSGEGNCALRWAAGQWTTVAGLIVAVAVVQAIRAGTPGRSPALSALGAYTAAHQLLSVPLGLTVFTPLQPFGAGDATWLVAYLSLLAVVAAAIGGLALGLRRGTWLGAILPIAVVAFNWALGLWPMLGFSQPPPWAAISAATGPVQMLALLAAFAGISRRAATPAER